MIVMFALVPFTGSTASDSQDSPNNLIVDTTSRLTGAHEYASVVIKAGATLLGEDLLLKADTIEVQGTIRGSGGTLTDPNGSSILLVAKEGLTVTGQIHAGDGYDQSAIQAEGHRAVGAAGGNGGSVALIVPGHDGKIMIGPDATIKAGDGGDGQDVTLTTVIDDWTDLEAQRQAIAGLGGAGGHAMVGSANTTYLSPAIPGSGGAGGDVSSHMNQAVNFVADLPVVNGIYEPQPMVVAAGDGGRSGFWNIQGLYADVPQDILASSAAPGGDGGNAYFEATENEDMESVLVHFTELGSESSGCQQSIPLLDAGLDPVCQGMVVPTSSEYPLPIQDSQCDTNEQLADELDYDVLVSGLGGEDGSSAERLTHEALLAAARPGVVCTPALPGFPGMPGMPAVVNGGIGGPGLGEGGTGGNVLVEGGDDGDDGTRGGDGACGLLTCNPSAPGGAGGKGGPVEGTPGHGGNSIMLFTAVGDDGGSLDVKAGNGGKGGKGGSYINQEFNHIASDVVSITTHGCNLKGECVDGATGGVGGIGGHASTIGSLGGNAAAFNIFTEFTPVNQYTIGFYVTPTKADSGDSGNSEGAPGAGGTGGTGGEGGNCLLSIEPNINTNDVVPGTSPANGVDVPILNCRGGTGGGGGTGGTGGEGQIASNKAGSRGVIFEGMLSFLSTSFTGKAELYPEGGGMGGTGGEGGDCFSGECAPGGLGGEGGFGGHGGSVNGGTYSDGGYDDTMFSMSKGRLESTGQKNVYHASGWRYKDKDSPLADWAWPTISFGRDGGHAQGFAGTGGTGGTGGKGGSCVQIELPDPAPDQELCIGGTGGQGAGGGEGGGLREAVAGNAEDLYDWGSFPAFPYPGGSAVTMMGLGGDGGIGGNGGDGLCAGRPGMAGVGGSNAQNVGTAVTAGKGGQNYYFVKASDGYSANQPAAGSALAGATGQPGNGSAPLPQVCPVLQTLSDFQQDGLEGPGLNTSVLPCSGQSGPCLDPLSSVMEELATTIPEYWCGGEAREEVRFFLGVQDPCEHVKWATDNPIQRYVDEMHHCVLEFAVQGKNNLGSGGPEVVACDPVEKAKEVKGVDDIKEWVSDSSLPVPLPCIPGEDAFILNCLLPTDPCEFIKVGLEMAGMEAQNDGSILGIQDARVILDCAPDEDDVQDYGESQAAAISSLVGYCLRVLTDDDEFRLLESGGGGEGPGGDAYARRGVCQTISDDRNQTTATIEAVVGQTVAKVQYCTAPYADMLELELDEFLGTESTDAFLSQVDCDQIHATVDQAVDDVENVAWGTIALISECAEAGGVSLGLTDLPAPIVGSGVCATLVDTTSAVAAAAVALSTGCVNGNPADVTLPHISVGEAAELPVDSSTCDAAWQDLAQLRQWGEDTVDEAIATVMACLQEVDLGPGTQQAESEECATVNDEVQRALNRVGEVVAEVQFEIQRCLGAVITPSPTASSTDAGILDDDVCAIVLQEVDDLGDDVGETIDSVEEQVDACLNDAPSLTFTSQSTEEGLCSIVWNIVADLDASKLIQQIRAETEKPLCDHVIDRGSLPETCEMITNVFNPQQSAASLPGPLTIVVTLVTEASEQHETGGP